MKALTSKTHDAIIYDKKCGQSSRTIAKQKVGLSARIPYHKPAMTETYCQAHLE